MLAAMTTARVIAPHGGSRLRRLLSFMIWHLLDQGHAALGVPTGWV
jgi:hypothetical protein